jgi:sulfate permease, SulP family
MRTMKPRTEIVSRKRDGTLGGIQAHKLQPLSPYFVPVRFDGSLTFINVAYFEDIILEANADFPEARTILVIGSGINDIDASGEEKIREVAERLKKVGVRLAFSGLKHQVRSLLAKGGLDEEIGLDAFYSDKETALRAMQQQYAKPPADTAAAGGGR